MSSKGTRSPLKDKPLRNPGQSVREQRFDLAYDKVLGPFIAASMLLIWAAMDWIRYFFPTPHQPWISSVFAVLALSYTAWQFRRHWPRIRNLKLAEEGEKHVGQLLEGLRASGYLVFHDLIGTDFNVDHVIIGPAGVLTIETKTWSKPRQGSPKIAFDGETLLAAGREPERNPVIQAKAQASWLKGLLAESTGKTFAVRPVVLFPGWYIEDGRRGRKDLWILEPKGLPAFLAQEKPVLAPEDISLAAFHLSRFIREQERVLEAKT
ncbi:MAG: nuclease-related domain-containing protein [Rhodocyclaceae bacterium]|nr:nuclease-related domain-containing protein [Rhodocyclaceae bacterium]